LAAAVELVEERELEAPAEELEVLAPEVPADRICGIPLVAREAERPQEQAVVPESDLAEVRVPAVQTRVLGEVALDRARAVEPAVRVVARVQQALPAVKPLPLENG
jgi:hypothetical protein